ncbi:MAG: hypothetical protein HC796_08540 [Synechococcaceae cyanobacterium RL_1_2]|nr:hypothetical protein [Synechococcaceae cyanobacterium RL_1_2]
MNRFLPSHIPSKFKSVGKVIKFISIAVCSSILIITMGWTQPLFSQSSSFDRAAQQIYTQLPDFPLGNNFALAESNQSLENNTLISRLLRYHRGKFRNNESRFDWKLTLADYLGLNEAISPDRYPGSSTLNTNPLEQDQALINQLNREEREALIMAIVNFYLPSTEVTETNSNQKNQPNDAIEGNPSVEEPIIPRAGDASLLGFSQAKR